MSGASMPSPLNVRGIRSTALKKALSEATASMAAVRSSLALTPNTRRPKRATFDGLWWAIESADFMFHIVRDPVFAASAADKAVVRESAGPAYIGARLIVGRVGKGFWRFVDKGEQQPLGDAVGDADVACGRKIAFHDVRHHVDDAACRLICREGERLFGVDYGESRFENAVCAQTQFLEGVAFGDDGVARAFTAGAGDGEHHADGQRVGDGLFADEEVPEITVVTCSGGNGFGRVDDRTASDGDESVDALVAGEANSFINKRVGGIGLDAAEFDIFYAYCLERILDSSQKAVGLDIVFAEDEYHPFGTCQKSEHADFLFDAAAEFI